MVLSLACILVDLPFECVYHAVPVILREAMDWAALATPWTFDHMEHE